MDHAIKEVPQGVEVLLACRNARRLAEAVEILADVARRNLREIKAARFGPSEKPPNSV